MSRRVVHDYELCPGANRLIVGGNAAVMTAGMSDGTPALFVEENLPDFGEVEEMHRLEVRVVVGVGPVGEWVYVGSVSRPQGEAWHVYVVEVADVAPGAPIPVADQEPAQLQVVRPSAGAVAPRGHRPFRQGLNAGGRIV